MLPPYDVVGWTLTATVVGCVYLVASQPSTPGGLESNRAPQQQAEHEASETRPARATTESPTLVRIFKDEADAKREQEDRDAEASNRRWALVLTGLTVIVAGLQAFVMWRQSSIASGQRQIMETQSGHMAGQLLAAIDAANAAKVSAEAAVQSVATLKILNKQWIDTSEFKFRMLAEGPVVTFVITNNTTAPLTVTRVITLGGAIDARDAQYGRKELPPKGRHRETFGLDRADAAKLFSDGERISMPIVGTVFFTDGFGEPREQRFARHLLRQATNGDASLSEYDSGIDKLWRHLLRAHPSIVVPAATSMDDA